MTINSLNNKKIGILGLGLENSALIKYLLKHKVKCEITVCDARAGTKNELPVFWQLGSGYNKNLDKFDILFRAPGWPIDCPGVQRALKIKSPLPLHLGKPKTRRVFIKGGRTLSSPMKLFFDLCPSKNIIGVTGTKGKGTTASLIYEILKTAGKKAWLGGNIGVAPFEFIDKIKKNDWVVLELSSFQLEDMTVSPRIAVITNLYPEHLAPADPNNPNYHRTLEKYWAAKMNIVKYQKPEDKAVLNYELGIMNHELKGKIFTFSARSQKANCFWLDEQKIKCKLNNHNSLPACRQAGSIIHTSLLGEHNKENIAAAVEAAKIVGIKKADIKKAVANFKGLPHRLELAREINGVKYYDDSFATTPEATIIALKSFSAPIILLLGGADKGANFKGLAGEVKKRVKLAILLNGDATPRIKAELLKVGIKEDKTKLVNSIKAAVKAAGVETRPGEVVLLSTACASFGMFKNYKERGDLFKQEVFNLK
ncbi:MAG: UDP-N-acetylmuramoyl-L-alanine--D-glutamate ligase [bacterium]|nr:UDP-N-acetylmuramoyl-L-alanine--D-glutamate ligase [bacterium]